MSFSVNRESLACPFDGAPTQVVGSGDFCFRCVACGAQFRLDGTLRGVNPQTPPLLVPPNDKASQGNKDW